MSPVNQAGPACQYEFHKSTSWPSCHVITKLIFDVLNGHTRTLANQAGLDKQADLGSCNQPLIQLLHLW